jgi:hypothetical protein
MRSKSETKIKIAYFLRLKMKLKWETNNIKIAYFIFFIKNEIEMW